MKRHKKSVRMSMMAGASAAAIAISLFGAGAAQAAGQRVSADCATTGAFGILHLKEETRRIADSSSGCSSRTRSLTGTM